jgi:hypothetical protein
MATSTTCSVLVTQACVQAAVSSCAFPTPPPPPFPPLILPLLLRHAVALCLRFCCTCVAVTHVLV